MEYLAILCYLFLFWSKVGFSLASNCTISSTQFSALQALFDSCNGPSWKWNSSSTKWIFPSGLDVPCTDNWQGLTCLSKPNNIGVCSIAKIELSSMNLTGPLPLEIGNFPDLADLKLDKNQISSSLPTTVGLLVHLQTLDLRASNITGSLSNELFNLQNLQLILFSDNQLTGCRIGFITDS